MEKKKQDKKERWQEIVSLLHYNEQQESYKKLSLSYSGKNIVLTLTEGKKRDKDSTTKINFSLSGQEVAYLAKALDIIFQKHLPPAEETRE